MPRAHEPQSRRRRERPQPPPRSGIRGRLTAETSLLPRGRSSIPVGSAWPLVRKTAFGRRTASRVKNPRTSEQAPHGRAPASPTARPQGGTLTAQTCHCPRGRSSAPVGRAWPIVRKTAFVRRTASHVKNPRTPEQAPHGRAPASPTARPQGGTLTAQNSLFPRGRSSVLFGGPQPTVRKTAFGKKIAADEENPWSAKQTGHMGGTQQGPLRGIKRIASRPRLTLPMKTSAAHAPALPGGAGTSGVWEARARFQEEVAQQSGASKKR